MARQKPRLVLSFLPPNFTISHARDDINLKTKLEFYTSQIPKNACLFHSSSMPSLVLTVGPAGPVPRKNPPNFQNPIPQTCFGVCKGSDSTLAFSSLKQPPLFSSKLPNFFFPVQTQNIAIHVYLEENFEFTEPYSIK